jgi:hypothetical protein
MHNAFQVDPTAGVVVPSGHGVHMVPTVLMAAAAIGQQQQQGQLMHNAFWKVDDVLQG